MCPMLEDSTIVSGVIYMWMDPDGNQTPGGWIQMTDAKGKGGWGDIRENIGPDAKWRIKVDMNRGVRMGEDIYIWKFPKQAAKRGSRNVQLSKSLGWMEQGEGQQGPRYGAHKGWKIPKMSWKRGARKGQNMDCQQPVQPGGMGSQEEEQGPAGAAIWGPRRAENPQNELDVDASTLP
ncbi:hypothetical protein DFH09DRAFT_1086800 [Mycena vulgaris]|nr:hypothetical protein DFH09DRAFT_1086799 [Mycena vulgaris]KAJ6549555.1 hypothetical protein DFH09DRAFT_1086800 [Mycena vulgaris]